MTRRNAARLSICLGTIVTTVAAWVSCGGSGNGERPPPVGSSGSSGSASGGTGTSGASGDDAGVAATAGLCSLPVADAANPIIFNGAGSLGCGTMIPQPRDGYWFPFNEPEAGVTTTIAGEKGGCNGASDCAVEAVGSGYVEYAGVGFNFNGGNGTNTAYDASQYAGITFWAKGMVTGSRAGNNSSGFYPSDQTIYAELIGATQRPMGDEYGAYCTLNSDPTMWTECTVNFATAARLGFSSPPESGPDLFDTTNLYKMEFLFSPFMGSSDAGARTVSFDVWIDDIYFY